MVGNLDVCIWGLGFEFSGWAIARHSRPKIQASRHTCEDRPPPELPNCLVGANKYQDLQTAAAVNLTGLGGRAEVVGNYDVPALGLWGSGSGRGSGSRQSVMLRGFQVGDLRPGQHLAWNT